ncbi:VOC family protein [Parasphingopyxis sp.]|uniref:VOC family protein n=1 Tax=Parasphingopyxis sp. TaxID=1920299 RepID=UPI00262A4D1C|nr:VOC family protein [Parasphingopyxis sp.]
MQLDHIVILASDIEASVRWYDRLLGLIGFTRQRDHVWANAEGFAVDLREARRDSRAYERFGPGLNHLGFTAPTMQALEAVRSGMGAAGFEVPEIQHFDDDRAAFFRDPDGLRVEIAVYG